MPFKRLSHLTVPERDKIRSKIGIDGDDARRWYCPYTKRKISDVSLYGNVIVYTLRAKRISKAVWKTPTQEEIDEWKGANFYER